MSDILSGRDRSILRGESDDNHNDYSCSVPRGDRRYSELEILAWAGSNYPIHFGKKLR